MSTPTIIGLAVGGAFLFVVVLLGALITLIRRWKAEARAELDRLLDDRAPALIDEGANCFGVESGGLTQIRGNGALAATDDEVLFVMWKPQRVVRIPRDRIDQVETVRSHLGKSKGIALLKVAFRNESDASDSVAWAVRDLDAWTKLLG